MKLNELQAIADRLKEFTFISRARRVEDNTIEITFDKSESYFFDMTRGHSTVYKAPSLRPLQGYNAPFDTLLHSLLSASKLLDVELVNGDRILKLKVAPKSSYKDKVVYLQLEFTGKFTNAILLDENSIIIEALRHIDSSSSFRVIRPGVELEEIPTKAQDKDLQEIENIDILLEERYKKLQELKLTTLKKQKALQIDKKIDKLKKEIAKLPNEAQLIEDEQKYKNYANIILANLYAIKPYDTKLKAYDFEGEEITIKFPKDIKVNRLSDYFFNLAKRAKAKAKNIHIEKQNLLSKKRAFMKT